MGYENYNASKMLSPGLYTVLLQPSVRKIMFFPYRNGRIISFGPLFFGVMRDVNANS